MFARSLLCRLAAPKTSTQDTQQLVRQVQRTLFTNAAPSPAIRALSRVYSAAIAESKRTFATSAATEPTRTVKKAVKKTAAAKKPATKKSTTAKKTTTKKKPAAEKKKAVKKAAPKPKKKRVAETPEQKLKKYVKTLRELALKEPAVRRPVSAYNVFVAEAMSAGGKPSEMAEFSAKFKSLSPSEREVSVHSSTLFYSPQARMLEFSKSRSRPW